MFKISRVLTKCQRVPCRPLGSAVQPQVILDKDTDNGIFTVSLNHPPVNSLGLEFMQEIIKALDIVEMDSKGLILTTANKSILSAGLDLQEMYNPEEAR
jgi:3,2-trans-enoyl-CoA isomerase